jgi:Spy/CpxP family protein refolding chaperone
MSKEQGDSMKTIVLVLALMISQAFAMGGKGESQKRGEEFRKELNLTDEQVSKFHELKKNNGDMKALKASFKESKKAFKDAMKNPSTSQEDLKAKFEAFMKLRDEVQRKKFSHMLEKRAILKPEQIEKFNQLRKKWHKGKGKHKGW